MSLCIATMETMVSSEIIQRYWSTKLLRHLETKIDLFLFFFFFFFFFFNSISLLRRILQREMLVYLQ